ncbi:MAG TPA: hypothetical protein VF215_16295 [Thermoanaerobaculia bacterium]
MRRPVERRRPAGWLGAVSAPVPGGGGGTPAFLLFSLLALPLSAQTDTIVAGVLGDSSIVAPVVSWNRSAANGDTLDFTLNGWTISAEGTRRRSPRGRGVVSLAITPLNAHSSDRIYVDGTRDKAREFDASTVEATFGRIDTFTHWVSDVRLVALYERVDDPFWSSPFAGIRTRQAWRRITSEDPLLLTFEGSEIGAAAEVFAGSHTWSRVRLDQRFSRRWGRVRAGESATAFRGSSIDTVNAFLVGGSWPVGELRPLYGYRYAELRLDRGVGVNVDASVAMTPSFILGAHAGALRSRDLDARGVAMDVTASWRGIGFRVGVGHGEETIVYGSILAARFR